MADKSTITGRENGPLLVKHLKRLTAADGSEIEVKEVMALCRCGGSSNKPFCDGTHNGIGFSGTSTSEAAGKDKVYSFEGTVSLVAYNPRLCSHAAECVSRAPKAFDPGRRPWIEPDSASRENLEEVVRACPSGALTLGNAGESPVQLVADAEGITIQKDGPYHVNGVELDEGPTAEGGSNEKYVLCRCGLSGAKPFCDGTHRDAGWTSD
jgi:CDGSH-type Zn-finger protein/ferredoxin